jgi:hypothetical protein
VNPDDFFLRDIADDTLTDEVSVELLEGLRRGPFRDLDDLNVAIGLTKLVHKELEAFATEGVVGMRLDADQTELALKAEKAVLQRLSIGLELPFRNLDTFRDHWLAEGISGTGSWQRRRRLLSELFEPVHRRLIELEEERFRNEVAAPIGGSVETGWQAVDNELRQLATAFKRAQTPQDYRNVGNLSVGVLEALSRTIYDPARHLPEGEDEPPVSHTKDRLDAYVRSEFGGRENAKLRTLLRSAIEYAQSVKHSTTPTRKEAAIAADSVVLLASTLRRLADD